jgi:hypothetical protein
MGVRSAVICGLVLMVVAGCQKSVEAPRTAGVCWRLGEGMNGRKDFKPFASGLETLEDCAARLEGAHLVNGQPMVGGFQGRIIYVTAEEVSVAADSTSTRYRVFTPQQRAKVDEGYRALRAREQRDMNPR